MYVYSVFIGFSCHIPSLADEEADGSTIIPIRNTGACQLVNHDSGFGAGIPNNDVTDLPAASPRMGQ
jgi:hypothetical protein